MKKEKKLLWYSLALMAFTSVWGFGNIINGFSEFGGLKAILAWIIIFIIYFIPYVLMVGELGSTFKNDGGGVSSWIGHTIGPQMAYYAGWTYWVVHMPYISQKPNAALIAASWAIFQDNRISQMNTTLLQFMSLFIFFLALWLASKGIHILNRLTTIAGTANFVLSLLFIVMMLAAPALTDKTLLTIDWNLRSFLPDFNFNTLAGLSILVFAVGGCEKISPYVNKAKNPAKDFPRGMIALAIMITVCAILGTIALGMMFDSEHIPADLMTNGAYYAFEKLGEYYHLGKLFVILYALTNLISQFCVLIISIDAPLRMLLGSADKNYIPSYFFKQNRNGAYTRGYILIAIIVSVLIIVPAFGIGEVDVLVRWLIRLNSVCMPLRYLWVFIAYIALKKTQDSYTSVYHFTKNKVVGVLFGSWCFLFTAFSCILGIYSQDPFQMVLNITTPFVLIALGVLMPWFAKRK